MSISRNLIIAFSVAAAIASGTYFFMSPKNIAAYNANVSLHEEIVQNNYKGEGEAEIYLAGGCFWGTEFLMRNVPGVTSVEVGYSNGKTRNPTYLEVCKGSGHAESAHVIYNPNVTPLTKILSIYYQSINLSFHQQGEEQEVQYRMGIYYSDPKDEPVIKESLKKLQKDFFNPIVVECAPIKNFYRAEEEHQEYLLKNPNGYCHTSHVIVDEKAKAEAAKTFKDKNFPRNKVYGKPSEETLKKLNKLQRSVTQEGATEPPYKNEYNYEDREGIYVDVTNGQPLFSSKDKFASGCGWPAFSKPIDPSFIEERKDFSFGMDRIEVRAKASGSHLGHLFDEEGLSKDCCLRYNINSAALRFIPREEMKKEGYGEWLDLFKD